MLEADRTVMHGKRPRAGRIHDLVRLAHQFEGFGERTQLLEIIEHAVGELLHAADDLIGQEEDHRKGADRDRAGKRIGSRERDEPKSSAKVATDMKLRITIRKLRRRRDAFISSAKKCEMKRRS